MINSSKIKRESFLWNMIGSLSNSTSLIILLMVVSRLVQAIEILGASYCYLILMIILSLLFILSLALSLKNFKEDNYV